MSHLNCLCTMPEITDEAVIDALFGSGRMRRRSSTAPIWRSLPNTRGN